jgi:hypothetical protein
MFATVLLFLVLASCSGLVSCRLGEERRPGPPPTIQGPPSPGTGFDTVPVTYGDFLFFSTQYSPQGGCETISFILPYNGYTTTEYFYSLEGLVTDVPGSNTDLTSDVFPALYQGNQNFIFVGKAKVTLPDGTTKILATKCLLDCVALGPVPGTPYTPYDPSVIWSVKINRC